MFFTGFDLEKPCQCAFVYIFHGIKNSQNLHWVVLLVIWQKKEVKWAKQLSWICFSNCPCAKLIHTHNIYLLDSVIFVKENLLFDPMCLPQSADTSAAGGTFWFTQWWYIGECSALPQYVPRVAVHCCY